MSSVEPTAPSMVDREDQGHGRRPALFRLGANVRRLSTLARLWVLLAVLVCLQSPAHGQVGSKRILLLYAGESTQPAGVAFTRGLIEGLDSAGGLRVELYSEYLDAARIPSADQREWMVRTIEEKYRTIPIDLVVAIGPDALQFIILHRDRLQLTAPVVFAGIRHEDAEPMRVPPFAAGITSRFSVAQTLDLALRLQPATRNIVVVAGAAPLDRAWERYARERLRPFEERLAITYLVGLPLEQLLAEVSRLPDHTVILFLTVMQDGTGDRFQSINVAGQVAAAANAPVYGVYNNHLGRGLVGGHMDSFESIGMQTAALAVRVLRGESPAGLGAQESNSHALVVDWRALQRWRIDEGRLPPEAGVRFREPSLWDTRRTEVLAVAGFIALQSLLIVALLIERRRRISAQRSLRESEEHIALAAASAHLGVWTWNVASDEIWTTNHCQDLLGLPSGQRMSTKSLLIAIEAGDRVALRRALGRAASAATTFEVEVRRAGGEGGAPRWLRVHGRVSRQGGAMTGVVMDITARKQAESEAEDRRQQLAHFRRVAELGGLSGTLAHELNQPLAAILGNAEAAKQYLAREPVDIPMIREIVDAILEEDTRARAVIERMRSLVRKSKPHRETIDVNRLVGDVIDLMHGELADRQVVVDVQLDDALPAVTGDPVQLQQVLINLMVNACEAMNRAERGARHLLVSTGLSDGGFVAIAVADRGSGIDPDMQQELFKPFVTTKGRNLGLGLSISRWILDEHGGRLSASNNAGLGATFTAELPIREEVCHGT